MKLIDYAENVIVPALKKKLVETNAKGYVLGLSGGIDSALVSLLAQKAVGKENILHIIMPCESDSKDEQDALEFCKKFDLRYKIVNLDKSIETLRSDFGEKLTDMSISNTKVRLRMVTLYAFAQNYSYLVLGTDNIDERYVGYFTKHGDGACDFLPISKLTKAEVFELSRILGCTESILNRKPSAGLWSNQTDEDELGVSYQDLDDYILGKRDHLSEKVCQRIEYLHKISRHKIDPIPECEDFER